MLGWSELESTLAGMGGMELTFAGRVAMVWKLDGDEWEWK